MIIAGTGTRSLVLRPEVMERVRQYLTGLLVSGIPIRPNLTVISGLAEGFDETLARAAITADVPFHAYVPTETYGRYYWQEHSQTGRNRIEEFNELLAKAASVRYVSKNLYGYVDGKRLHANILRNMAMVKDCDKLWVYDPGVIRSGTKQCHDFAISIDRPIFYVREANIVSNDHSTESGATF